MAEQQYDWFYLNAQGEQDGPHTREELLGRWRTGEVRASSLVWAPGMGAWARFDESFPDLQPPAPPPVASPPPAPTGQRPVDRPAPAAAAAPEAAIPAAWLEAPAGTPMAQAAATARPRGALESPGLHPWRRYFAKQVDVFIFSFGSMFLLMVLLEITSPDAARRLGEGLDNPVVGAAISVFFWGLCEWVCLAMFGGTPGRALYGIRLRRMDGSPLGSEKAFSRAFLVGIKGLGLGIPIVALFTCLVGYNVLTKEGRSTWDADLGTRVSHIIWSPWRVLGVVTVTAAVLFMAAVFVAMAQNVR
jgi:hypothetical protein